MDLTFILITLAVAAWLASMLLALFLPLEPRVLKLTSFLLCPGTELFVDKFQASYHRPGQFGIEVYYFDQNQKRQDVKFRALLVFWCICLAVGLPIAWLLVKWFLTLPI